MKKEKDFLVSSGNLYADLGFPEAEERQAKMNLVIQINDLIKHKKLSQKKAAEVLGVDQPKISALSNGKLSGFSLERLFHFLTLLGQTITIKVAPKTRTSRSSILIQAPVKKRVPAAKKEAPSAGLRLHARKKK